MEKEILDYVLVPLGLVVMVSYHLWLLRQVLRRPSTTVIGINAGSRRLWVRAMMGDTGKNGILAVQTLRNNIMASTVLASTAIMLSSIIAVLMSSGGGDRFSIKFLSILMCFLGAFLLNVQSIRYYSHASMLINVPTSRSEDFKDAVTADYVCRTVNRGSYFWSLGLHAFYISFPLFLWIFGPIPMFLSSLVLVFLLYFLDVAADVATVFTSAPQDQLELV
ncbi:uncharacterized protein LOC131016121 [Salvia miltiorrhiza]|uniref:uncharacterized protein LOC131016121 n=1 Tax=Salvia miltiorrhiza TaxID=226208 RepID=UPI0025AC27BB|nr:uncharacterized protein LOC131016121 [Salvia miltiorrhiza]